MNEPKHTPGPWKKMYSDRVTTASDTDGSKSIAHCYNDVHDCEANARLIVAAPDLLAALTKIVIAEFGSLDHPQIKNSGMWASAKAAIEKAVSNG